MNVELREIAGLIAIVDEGSFTDAAIALRTSQSSVSRNLSALEGKLGVRLLRRTTRSIELTEAGVNAVRAGRRVLAAVDELIHQAQGGTEPLRLGYAWSALGSHTIEFQRRWAAAFPVTELELVHSNTATAGLTDGTTRMAILRRPPDPAILDFVLIGTESRYCAVASGDAMARRRSVRLADLAERTVAIDTRTGSTTLDLWAPGERPSRVVSTLDIDDWLTKIASGSTVGITSGATRHQYPRPGISYRPIRDAPPIPVYVAWLRDDPPAQRIAVVDLLVDLYRTKPHP
jgi:DNA-binding transcriptional LysR family regulator